MMIKYNNTFGIEETNYSGTDFFRIEFSSRALCASIMKRKSEFLPSLQGSWDYIYPWILAENFLTSHPKFYREMKHLQSCNCN